MYDKTMPFKSVVRATKDALQVELLAGEIVWIPKSIIREIHQKDPSLGRDDAHIRLHEKTFIKVYEKWARSNPRLYKRASIITRRVEELRNTELIARWKDVNIETPTKRIIYDVLTNKDGSCARAVYYKGVWYRISSYDTRGNTALLGHEVPLEEGVLPSYCLGNLPVLEWHDHHRRLTSSTELYGRARAEVEKEELEEFQLT